MSISGLGGVKEWKKKLLCWTFFRFSRTFPPLIFSPRQSVSRHLAGKAHCNAGTATHQHARKTAPQCCKHRQLVLPTKLKPICIKFQIFHFTLTSLDFTLSYLNNLLSSIWRNKKNAPTEARKNVTGRLLLIYYISAYPTSLLLRLHVQSINDM